MENKHVEENPGPSKSDLIIITPDECMELGLFQDIRGVGGNSRTNQSTENSDANLKQKIRNKIEAAAAQSRNVQTCESQFKGKKDAKPIILDSKIAAIENSLSSIALGKLSATVEAEVANNEVNKKVNVKESLTHGNKKVCTLTPKVLNSGLNMQNSISNKKAEPIVLNSAVSKFPQGKYKRKHIAQKTSNKTEPIILNSSVIPGNIALTKSNKKLFELNKGKPKILNSQIIKPIGENHEIIKPKSDNPEFKNQITYTTLKKDTSDRNKLCNIQMKLEGTATKEGVACTSEPNTCAIVKPQKLNVSKIEVKKESEEDATTAKTTKNLENRNNCTEVMNSEVARKEVNIINNTPVCFSIEELKDLVSKAKNVSKECIKISFANNKEKEMQSPLKTAADNSILDENVSFITEMRSQLLPQPKHSEDVIIENVGGTQISTTKREEITNIVSEESQNTLELHVNNGLLYNKETSVNDNEMKIGKIDTSKDVITSVEDKGETLNDNEVELQNTENKKILSNDSLSVSIAKRVCHPQENKNQQRESQLEENQFENPTESREEKERPCKNPQDVNDEIVTIVPQEHSKTNIKDTDDKADRNSAADSSNSSEIKSSNLEPNMSDVLKEEYSTALKKHFSKLATDLETTYSVKGTEEKVKEELRKYEIEYEIQNKEESKTRKQKTSLNCEQNQDIEDKAKTEQKDGEIENVNYFKAIENKQPESNGKHNMPPINLKPHLDSEKNTAVQKESKAEEIRSNSSRNGEDKMSNKDHKNAYVESTSVTPSVHNEQHVIPTEKNKSISDKAHKNPGTPLAEETNDFGAKKGGEVTHNTKAYQSEYLHKLLPESKETATIRSQTTLEATYCNIKENKKHIEVDKGKAVDSYPENPSKTEDKEAFAGQTGIANTQDIKSEENETVKTYDIKIQVERPLSEIAPIPEKYGRKKKMLVQDNQPTVEESSEGERCKKESVDMMKKDIVEEIQTEDDKANVLHSQLKNSSDIEVAKHDADPGNIQYNEHSTKREKIRSVTAEDGPLSTELISVPKKRGRKRKIIEKESNLTFQDNKLEKTVNKDIENRKGQKGDKEEDIQSNNGNLSHGEEKVMNEDHTNISIELTSVTPSVQNEHVISPEKNKSIDIVHKNLGTRFAEETKDFDAKEGGEVKITYNTKAYQSNNVHKLPKSKETGIGASRITLQATCNIKENEAHIEVDKSKAVKNYSEDPFKTEEKEAFAGQTATEWIQDIKSEENESMKKYNITIQVEHPATELTPTPKKRGRKKKMIMQDNQSTVKENSEGEGCKKKSVGGLKSCMKNIVEEIKTEDDKSNALSSQLKNSSDMEMVKQDADPGNIQHNDHSTKHEIRTVTAANNEVKTEDGPLSTKVISVSKKRGRKRKIIVESNFTLKDNKLEETDNKDVVEKNVSNSSKYYTTNLNEKNGISNLDHPHPRSPRDNLNTTVILKGDSNSTFFPRGPLKNTCDDAAVLECKTTNISTDAKLPKKKGRPRKKANLTETQEYAVSAGPPQLNDEEMVTSTPLPKKRGRKRKGELPSGAAETTETVQTIIEPVTSDEPLGKRKRKKINYFNLENSITAESDFGEKQKRRRSLPKNISEINPTKLKTNSINKRNVSTLDVADPEGNSSSKSCVGNIQEGSDTTNSSAFSLIERNSIHATSELENTNGVKPETDNIQDSEVNTSGEDKTEKKSKYRRTGETVLMMKSIFSAAVKNTSISDSGADQSCSENTSSESKSLNVTSTKRGRGRIKRSEEAKLIVVDEGNMVTCMGCNKKIDNSEWDIHNRKIHYNLGWREGEQALNLDDPTFVAQKVKPILKQEKALICNKCERKDTSVKEFITHMEQCSGILSSAGLITCAICKQQMEKSKWNFHKQRQHNNLAWRIGDRPLDLNNQNLVISILNALYKVKKPLYCEKCGIQKKSVIGFLSHQSQCGMHVDDAKVKCQFCNRRVLPVSMQSHIKFVHEAPKTKDDLGELADYFDVELRATSTKRKAAKTAMLIIDKFSKQKIVQEHTKHYVTQLDFNEEGFVALTLKKELAENQMIKCKFKGCGFETDEVKTLLDHMNLCERKPDQYYTCKKCISICDSENAIIEHIKTVHNIDIVEDDYKADYDDVIEEDDEIELYHSELRKRMLFEKRRLEKDINYKIKPACTFKFVKRSRRLFSHALYFTSEFCQEHFSKPLLFNHLRYLRREWILLDDVVEKYLPKSGQSCAVARRICSSFKNVLENEYTLKKFELFEADADEGVTTIFCGGPIYAMAWLPTPYTSLKSNQILAVATTNDFDEKYLVNVNYSVPTLIQFWDFGVLQNRANTFQPKLMFGLAFDFGPVWHMEWCPSGCFDDKEVNQNEEKMSRMGLLAVAGSNSMVYIYSIPFLKEEEMGLIYKGKPSLKLCLVYNDGGSLGNEKFYATRISWSTALGHIYLAVGYTNGMVGLFNLETSSKLLKCKDNDNVDVLLPYKAFQAHTHYISALNLVHLSGGNRWLLTGSFDKDTFAWDLSNGSKVSTSKKHIVTDGVWLTNWIAYVTTADESSTNYGPVHACIKAYRDYMYEHVYLTTCPTSILSLSSSNWLNSVIQGSSVGEIFALFPNQLIYSLDSKRILKSSRYIFGCVRLIDKRKTPAERAVEEDEKQRDLKPDFKKMNNSDVQNSKNPVYNKYEPINYNEADEKYGLLFCDRKMNTYNDLHKGTQEPQDALKCEELEFSKPNLYPLQAINKIAYNPNRQASLYYATGYQAGFVRLTYIKFLENDPQIV